jgi:ABC-type uncharacterized transport system permease subunit
LTVLAAILIGGIVIAAMGRSPAQAFVVFFLEPLTQSWSLQEIALKATPLVIIAIGLSFCFRANLWNIGAEGAIHHRCACAGASRAAGQPPARRRGVGCWGSP